MKLATVLIVLILAGCGMKSGVNESEGMPLFPNVRWTTVSGDVLDFSQYRLNPYAGGNGFSNYTYSAPVQVKQGALDCLCVGQPKLEASFSAVIDCGGTPSCESLSGKWGITWNGHTKETKMCHGEQPNVTCHNVL